MNPLKTITFRIDGLGIIFYSPFAVTHITPGEDYLDDHYWEYEDMIAHVEQGTLVGVGTGSPGRYTLHIIAAPPAPETASQHKFKCEVGLEVRDDTLCFRDLYDLMDWLPDCPPEQTVEIESGYYLVNLYSDLPASGILGDKQVIWLYFTKTPQLPQLVYDNVPEIFE